MTERPILMTPENAQKCFEGVKTQTRRLLKQQPDKFQHVEYDSRKGWQYWWDVGSSGMSDVRQEYAPLKCPYGAVSDRLWIKEASWIWGTWVHEEDGWHFREHYSRRVSFSVVDGALTGKRGDVEPRWIRRPGIFMPRWACRTVVEITEIRVQRVQDCSTEDAIAEGAETWEGECLLREKRLTKAQLQYAALWESINGAGSWDANPFVWALTFKKVSA